MHSSPAVAVTVSLLFVAAACRSGTAIGPLAPTFGSGEAGAAGPRSSVVTARELVAVADRPLDQALRQLRPEFLRVRMVRPGEAGLPSVYVNERYAGDADVLKLIPIGIVNEVVFLTPVAAKSRYGSLCPCGAGALVVTTQRQD